MIHDMHGFFENGSEHFRNENESFLYTELVYVELLTFVQATFATLHWWMIAEWEGFHGTQLNNDSSTVINLDATTIRSRFMCNTKFLLILSK